MHILCLGDSITDCGHLLEAPPLGWGYVYLLQEAFRNSPGHYTISNHGVDGLTLIRLLQGVTQGSIPAKADIVTVLIGINDISLMQNTHRSKDQQKAMLNKFSQNYRKLLDILDARKIILIEPFLFSRPAEYLTWLPNLHHMASIISSLAQERGLIYVPLQNRLNAEAKRLDLSQLTTDGIHLTIYGHEIIAKTLYQTICD